jgi:hypothetical protein
MHGRSTAASRRGRILALASLRGVFRKDVEIPVVTGAGRSYAAAALGNLQQGPAVAITLDDTIAPRSC